MPSPDAVDAAPVSVGSRRRSQSVKLGKRPAEPAIPSRIEMPHQPPTPVWLETPVQPERPVQPVMPVESERRIKTAKPVRIVTPPAPGHLDEIGRGVDVSKMNEQEIRRSRT
jgi:hypothetical protein